jgi:hypothetical protein
MPIAQGLGTPVIYLVPILVAAIASIAVAFYFLIYWLGKTENKSKRLWFSGLVACFVFYQIAFPNYVSSDALTSAATTGAPSSRLIERLGAPHSISEITKSEMMWYYETGYFATRTFGVTINRSDGKIVDWYVQ